MDVKNLFLAADEMVTDVHQQTVDKGLGQHVTNLVEGLSDELLKLDGDDALDTPAVLVLPGDLGQRKRLLQHDRAAEVARTRQQPVVH